MIPIHCGATMTAVFSLPHPSLRIMTGLVLCLVTGSALYGLRQYSLRDLRGQEGLCVTENNPCEYTGSNQCCPGLVCDMRYGSDGQVYKTCIANSSCVPQGGPCGANNECCSQFCDNLVCTQGSCMPNGAGCGFNTDCCSGLCTNNYCGGGGGGCTTDADCNDNDPCTVDVCHVSSTCSHDPVSAGTVCRAAAAGGCDVAEICNENGACPADSFASATTVCRAANGVCDVAESCTGSSAACPQQDGKKTSGTACASDNNPCTLDQCNGTSNDCQHPAGNAGAVCRAAVAGGCDIEEKCTGALATCPADTLQPSGTVCRTSTQSCDLAETCTGSSNACPTNINNCGGPVCGNGTVESGEQCEDGDCCESTTCKFAAATTVCRQSQGLCDRVEYCNGTAAACPADAVAPNTVVCRPSTKSCDPPEFCPGGSSKACPADFSQCGASSSLSSSTAPCSPQGAGCTKHSDCCSLSCTGLTGQQKCAGPLSSSMSSSSHPSEQLFCCAVSPSATAPEHACIAVDNDENFSCINGHRYDSIEKCQPAESRCQVSQSSSSSSNNKGAFVMSCTLGVPLVTVTTAKWGDTDLPPPILNTVTRMTKEEPTDGDKASMSELCALSPTDSVCCSNGLCKPMNANECSGQIESSFAGTEDCQDWVEEKESC